MLIKDAVAITGGIGFTSKTGFSFGLPAKTTCKVGCKLSKVKGSTCFGCYAKGGNYSYPSTKKAHANRLIGIKKLNDASFRKQWVEAMTTLINRDESKNDKSMWFFRWHDSGDLISVDHLLAIAEVADATPEVKHWIPTKESDTVKKFMELRDIPKNLNIRLSAHFVDKCPETDYNIDLPKAAVYKDKPTKKGHICQAILQHKGCHEIGCRACWNKKIKLVNYKLHR